MRKLLINISILLLMQYAYPMKCCPYCSKDLELPQETAVSSEPSIFSSIDIDWDHPIGKGNLGQVYKTNHKDWVAKINIVYGSEELEKEVARWNKYYEGTKFPPAFIKSLRDGRKAAILPRVGDANIFDIFQDYTKGINKNIFKEVQQAVKDKQLDDILQRIKNTIGTHNDISGYNLVFNIETKKIYLVDFSPSILDDNRSMDAIKQTILSIK